MAQITINGFSKIFICIMLLFNFLKLTIKILIVVIKIFYTCDKKSHSNTTDHFGGFITRGYPAVGPSRIIESPGGQLEYLPLGYGDSAPGASKARSPASLRPWSCKSRIPIGTEHPCLW
jgi:hypothetical protein